MGAQSITWAEIVEMVGQDAAEALGRSEAFLTLIEGR